jgi:hypothetical protein
LTRINERLVFLCYQTNKICTVSVRVGDNQIFDECTIEEKYIMKQKTRFSALTAGAVAISLLLGAGTAQAAEVILDGDTVTRIENLDVVTDCCGVVTYDVDFRFDTGFNVYGQNLDGFPFVGENTEEDAFAALIAINNALDANTPVPSSAGVPSQNIYYIGVEEETQGSAGLIAAVGGEFLGGAGWEACQPPNCVAGAAVTQADLQFTYADLTEAGGPPPGTATVVAASLPSSRSVQVGNLASAVATVINTSNTTATDCSIAPQTSVPADFTYQTTDAANAPVGSPNTPADIPAGGSQNFVFGFLPTEPITPTEVQLSYDCTNSDPAPVSAVLNTLFLTASATPVADIVALAMTPTSNGILDLTGSNGSNAFSVGTVNAGSTDTITASAAAGSLPVILSICETNATGDCLSAEASSTTSSVSAGATPTYSVFVTANGTVPFDPANNRIVVMFTDAGGAVRGLTSVAVRTL